MLERGFLERRGFGQQRKGMFFGERHAHGVACYGVLRWSMRPAKLLTRSPLVLRLMAFLDFAAAEGSVETTGEDRSARAASRSVSWNKSDASARVRCHST